MTTLFEQQGVQYELQGDYRLPCVTLPNESNFEIGVWGERHRQYLKEHHKVRYYNLLTPELLIITLQTLNVKHKEYLSRQ